MGFPDISTLEPLAKALDVTVLELMRSRRSEMNNQNLSENEVTEIMSGAVEMARENQKQEKISLWIGGAITIGVAVLVRLSGRANSIKNIDVRKTVRYNICIENRISYRRCE